MQVIISKINIAIIIGLFLLGKERFFIFLFTDIKCLKTDMIIETMHHFLILFSFTKKKKKSKRVFLKN